MTQRTIATCGECRERYIDWADGPSGCPKCKSMDVVFDNPKALPKITVRPEVDALCALVERLEDELAEARSRANNLADKLGDSCARQCAAEKKLREIGELVLGPSR